MLVDSEPSFDPVLAGDFLRLENDEPITDNMFYIQTADIAMPDTVVVMWRCRIISGTENALNRGISNVVITTAPRIGISLDMDFDGVWLQSGNTANECHVIRNTVYPADTENFQDYRLEIIQSTGLVRLFYNGNHVLTGQTYDNVAANGSVPRVLFGGVSICESGTSDWVYVGHNAYSSGCSPQPPEVGVPVGSGVELPEIVAMPNPFSIGTMLAFRGSRGDGRPARVSITDVSGRQIHVLNTEGNADEQLSAYWNGRDGLGRPVAAGVYFAKVIGQSAAASTRIVKIR
jgi:hypothetical protein